jgi:predicted RNA-binding Zn-ribbon protein involved in translation (DUF1610 family)
METMGKMIARRKDPRTFDHTYPYPACGYRIPPAELMHVDSQNIRCPQCKAETLYDTSKAQMTS